MNPRKEIVYLFYRCRFNKGMNEERKRKIVFWEKYKVQPKWLNLIFFNVFNKSE